MTHPLFAAISFAPLTERARCSHVQKRVAPCPRLSAATVGHVPALPPRLARCPNISPVSVVEQQTDKAQSRPLFIGARSIHLTLTISLRPILSGAHSESIEPNPIHGFSARVWRYSNSGKIATRHETSALQSATRPCRGARPGDLGSYCSMHTPLVVKPVDP